MFGVMMVMLSLTLLSGEFISDGAFVLCNLLASCLGLIRRDDNKWAYSYPSSDDSHVDPPYSDHAHSEPSEAHFSDHQLRRMQRGRHSTGRRRGMRFHFWSS